MAKYAGFWYRLLAYFIDWIIIIVAMNFMLQNFLTYYQDIYYLINDPYVFQVIKGLFALPITWLYYAIMESSKYQATIGKSILGISVTDLKGNRISFGRASGRFFAKIISGLTLGVGYIMIAFTEKKQGLHDMIAECLVIKK